MAVREYTQVIKGKYDTKGSIKAMDILNNIPLTVENDDKASMYSVKELYEGIYKKIGVPIVFDFYHHKFCTGGLTEQEALELALSTWPKGITPCTHYSESRRKEKLDESIRAQAHSDLIYNKIPTYGNEFDCVVEAKHKELAIVNYNRL